MQVTKECVGHCPACDSEDLEYGLKAPFDEGDFRYYPFTCNQCGASGEECFELTYVNSSAEKHVTAEEVLRAMGKAHVEVPLKDEQEP